MNHQDNTNTITLQEIHFLLTAIAKNSDHPIIQDILKSVFSNDDKIGGTGPDKKPEPNGTDATNDQGLIGDCYDG
jgi:hypothetical protein